MPDERNAGTRATGTEHATTPDSGADQAGAASPGAGDAKTGTGQSDRALVATEREARDVVRDAHDQSTPLRIVGRGTWLRGGHRVAATRHLDLRALSGIVEYVPGDLTLTALAGTALAEIADAVEPHRQWLPLDPFGDPNGTLGATLATASSGPTGSSIGLPRDLTVGLAFVTGEGTLVRGGGRVVKNVAGFDLVRLTIGAWGTLGVIVEATVRLRARPDADVTLSLDLPEEPERLATFLAAVRAAPVEPLSAELLNATLGQRIAVGDGGVLLVRLAGNAVSVRHQVDVLARLGASRDVSGSAWTRLRQSDPDEAVIVRMSRRPTELPRLWSTALAIPGVEAHASLTRGIVRLRIPGAAASNGSDPLAAFEAEDVRIVEQAPPDVAIVRQPRAMDGLAERLRLAFDPRAILNRGILGEPAP